MNIDDLNTGFGMLGSVLFVEGKGGFPFINLDSGNARAVISLYGGHVLSFQPKSTDKDLLFLSEKAYFQEGKAIRGGIPVCWPWFGADPEGLGRSAHGFARNSLWSVIETNATDNGEVQVVLGLQDSDESRAIWPYEFKLSLHITVGSTLRLALKTTNAGDKPFSLTQALHSYFTVGDIAETQVLGLDGYNYIDKAKAGNSEVKLQQGSIGIAEEVDRIYMDISSESRIVDAALGRQISISSGGSNSTVVWNPWVEIAASMSDLDDEDFRRFLCVETTNAAPDVVEVKPGAEHCITAEYNVSPLDG